MDFAALPAASGLAVVGRGADSFDVWGGLDVVGLSSGAVEEELEDALLDAALLGSGLELGEGAMA